MTKSILASLAGVLLSAIAFACPTSLNVIEQSCGNYVFYLAETPVGNVIWDFGDGNSTTGSIEIQHDYAEDGVYVVSAIFSGPECPETIMLFATIEVNCGIENCPAFIDVESIDCDSYLFSLDGVETGEVAWDFGDGITENSSVTADHSYAENGVYINTAVYNGPACPMAWTNVLTVQVNCASETECPTEIWSGAGAECGVMNFEIGSFVQGENVVWYPGDDTGAMTGGHFFSHQYAQAGVYTVCAFYTTPLCPDGVELCTVITVESCEQPCNEIGFGIDSYILEGGTPWLTYMISNVETGMMIVSGSAEYTENDPYFDTPLCLPDGCYYLSIDNNNPLLIGQGVNIFFILNSVNLMENATIIYQDEIAITYLIGVNTDCAGPPSCEAAFEPIYTNTPGHIEFVNNSTFSGVVEFLWDYGNGTTSDGVSGNVFYESNGVYTVCLTVSTGNCTNTSCQLIVVDDMETPCEFNEVSVVVDANYFEPVNELLQFMVSVPLGPVFQTSIETDGIMNDTLSLCIPDGCYEVSINAPLPVQALSIVCTIEGLNVQQLGDLQLNIGESSSVAAIGVNMDCTIGIEESNTASINAFPNPATDNIQFVSEKTIQHIEIFDMTGKRIATLNPNQSQVQFNTSQWSTGLYAAHIMSEGKIERAIFEIAR